MFACCFLGKLWGRMQYAPTLTDKKGAFSLFVVGRGRGVLARAGFSNSLGLGKLEVFGCRYFYVTGNGRINMFLRYFLMELWGRMQYAPTLTNEKGACFLFVVGRGRGGLAGMDFFYLLGR